MEEESTNSECDEHAQSQKILVGAAPNAPKYKRSTLLPKCLLVRLWETLVAVTTVLSVTFVTIQAAFDAGVVWQIVLLYLFDCIYVVAILLRFLTGYEEKGVAVTNHRKIAVRYLKSTLVPDLISVVPLELTSLAADNSMYVAAFLRLNRLVRCYRLLVLCCELNWDVIAMTITTLFRSLLS